MKKERIIHTITIKLVTTGRSTTETVTDKIAELIAKDKKFTEKFTSIMIKGKNNLE